MEVKLPFLRSNFPGMLNEFYAVILSVACALQWVFFQECWHNGKLELHAHSQI